MIIVVQIVAAVLFTVGIRDYGSSHRDSARSGLWIAPTLWALMAVLTAPAAAAWRRQPLPLLARSVRRRRSAS